MILPAFADGGAGGNVGNRTVNYAGAGGTPTSPNGGAGLPSGYPGGGGGGVSYSTGIGGSGGIGGAGNVSYFTWGGGGNGGAGGNFGFVGAATFNALVSGTAGGAGANGGDGGGAGGYGGGAGGGGEGGGGALLTGDSINNENLLGASGGAGGNGGGTPGAIGGTSGGGGGGGAGGSGVVAANNLYLQNYWNIIGGNGGNGGAGGTSSPGNPGAAGVGGNGGNGVLFLNGGALYNQAVISGGNGGAGGGVGGAGVVGAGINVINHTGGTISGGLAGDGITRANAITFLGGANTLTLEGGSFVGNIGIAGGSLAFNQTSTQTLSNAITGGGSLIQNGTGALTLSGANSYSGGTTLAGGTLVIGNNSALGLGSLSMATGTTLSFASGANYAINNNIAISGTANFTPALGQANTISGVISDGASAGSVSMQGPGTLVFSGFNTYTGGTTIAAGTLQLGNGGTTGSITGNVTNNATFAFNRADSYQYSGAISGTGTVQQAGVGTTILSGANSYTGGTTITAGTVQIGNGGTTGSITGNVTNNATLAFNRADSYQYSGAISGTGTVRQSGIGTTILSGANSYTGGTAITAGTLQIGNGGTTGSITGNVTNNATFAFNRSDAITFGGNISGTGALSQNGTGTTTLTGNNTYTGGTTIAGGVLSVANDSNLGAAPGALTFNGGLLATTGSFGTGRAITFVQNGRFDVTAGTELGLTGMVSGGGDLVKSGAGTLRIDNGANAYGNTIVQAGTLIGNAKSISGNLGNAATVVFDQAGSASFAGNIAAWGGSSGAMVKRGAGALTLTGLSSLDWTVEAGSLVSSAERFGGNAAIASGASLTFERNTNTAYAGMLTGSGSFYKAGSGLLNLTGDSSLFAGTTTVGNGILAVNGKLGGMLNVQSTGRLQGVGTVGNINTSGTVAPGNSIGTLNVIGNITFNPGSVYEVEANAAGQSDKIIATGTATINGGTVRVLNAPGAYSFGTRYAIVTAAGGRSGTFAGLTQSSQFPTPFMVFALNYDPTHVYLDVSRSAMSFAAVGQTRNQIATGGGLDSVPLSSPQAMAVALLDATSAGRAFDQLSGEVQASAKTALIEDSRFMRDAAIDRLRSAFGAVGAGKTPVVSYASGDPEYMPATIDRFAFWGRAFGSWGHTDGDGNAARLKRSTGGLFVGGDGLAFDTWRLGLIAGYSRTNFNVRDTNSSGSSDNYHAGLYGGTQWGALAFRSGAAYTWHDIATSRAVAFPGFSESITGKYGASTVQAFGELAYGVRSGNVGFEPFANLAYVKLHTDGFSEKGGAAALSSNGGTQNTAFSTLGLRALSSFRLGGSSATARGTLGWRHAFSEVMPGSAMAFAGGAPFTIVGVPIARNAGVAEVGLDLALTPSALLGLSYSGQFASGAADQSVRANFKWVF